MPCSALSPPSSLMPRSALKSPSSLMPRSALKSPSSLMPRSPLSSPVMPRSPLSSPQPSPPSHWGGGTLALVNNSATSASSTDSVIPAVRVTSSSSDGSSCGSTLTFPQSKESLQKRRAGTLFSNQPAFSLMNSTTSVNSTDPPQSTEAPNLGLTTIWEPGVPGTVPALMRGWPGVPGTVQGWKPKPNPATLISRLEAKAKPGQAKSRFEMCFDIGSQHLGCWGQNTSRIQNKEAYATLCLQALLLGSQSRPPSHHQRFPCQHTRWRHALCQVWAGTRPVWHPACPWGASLCSCLTAPTYAEGRPSKTYAEGRPSLITLPTFEHVRSARAEQRDDRRPVCATPGLTPRAHPFLLLRSTVCLCFHQLQAVGERQTGQQTGQ